jgi:translation initiation factor IF-2
MSKVRLYHLARNWDVPARDVLDALAEKGRRLKSHFAEVDAAEVPEIRAILQDAGLFGRPAAAAVAEAPPPAPVEVSAPVPAPRAVEPQRVAPAAVEAAEKPARAEKVERVEKPAEKVEKAEKPSEKTEKPSDKPEKAEKPAKADKAHDKAHDKAPAKPAEPEPVKAAEPRAAEPAKAAAPAAPAVAKPAAAAAAGAKPAAPGAKPVARPAPAAASAPPPPVRPTSVAGQPAARPNAVVGGGARPNQPRSQDVMGAPRTGGPSASSAAAQPHPTAPPRSPAPARPGEGPRPAVAASGAPGAPRPAGGPFVANDNQEFRPGRIVSRAPVPAPGSQPPRPAGAPANRFGPPGAPANRFGPAGAPANRFGPPGARPGPGGPPGRFGPPGRAPDFAMPEIRERRDIPITPNLRGDEESRRRSRFGPAAPSRTGARGGPPNPGGPGEPGQGDGPPGSRTAISPAKKGKQATRRSGPGGSTGAGRRMERRMHERDRWKRASTKRKRTIKAGPINRPTECTIELPISVKDLSAKFAVRIADIMQILMQPPHNLMLNMNAPVPSEAVALLATHFGIAAEITDEVDVDDATVKELEEAGGEEKAEDLVTRQPVIAVLGHVDHGKTSLLDRLRQTKAPVAEKEAGGITQHIGAYVAEHDGKMMTFLDTPGHEAFTSMRMRGANVTDIVMLVVAADDGVMPQTKEAIAHAKAANATIVVAMNKIDKPNANTAKVMQQLAAEGLNPVEWGGETEVIPVSALTGEGIDKLMETLSLTAEVMDLKANPNKAAKGTVLEAKKSEGRGIVATVLIEDGTLHRGDLMLCGRSFGKCKMMFSDRGKPVKEAGPGVPVEVLGLTEIPTAGDRIYVMEDEKKAREIIEQREDERRLESATKRIGVSAENIWDQLGKADVTEVRLILKTDVSGSLEVLKNEIEKLSLTSSEVRLRLLHAQVGTITTSDVILAEASKPCFIIGFTVTADPEAAALAREKALEIRTYKIIYELLDDLKKIMSGEIAPEEKEVVLGTVLIRQTFKSSKVGTIAGCVVEKGTVKRSGKARLNRDGIVIWEGDIESLKRFKEDVKEVKEGFECGLKLKGYDEVKEGDKVEVYEVQKIARSL